jgi:hypothetical protein
MLLAAFESPAISSSSTPGFGCEVGIESLEGADPGSVGDEIPDRFIGKSALNHSHQCLPVVLAEGDFNVCLEHGAVGRRE